MKMLKKLSLILVLAMLVCSLSVLNVSAATEWGVKNYATGKTASETFTDSSKSFADFLEHNKYEYAGNGTAPTALFGRAVGDNSLKIYNTGAYSAMPDANGDGKEDEAAYRRVWSVSKPNAAPANCAQTVMRFYVAFGGVRETMYVRANVSGTQQTVLKLEDTGDYFPENGKWYRAEIVFDVSSTSVTANLYVDGELKLSGTKTVSITKLNGVVVQFFPGSKTPRLKDSGGNELYGYETAETYIDDLYFYYDTGATYSMASAPALASASKDFAVDGLKITTSSKTATVADFKAAVSGYKSVTVRNGDGTDAADTDTIKDKYVIVDDFYTYVSYVEDVSNIYDSESFDTEFNVSTTTAMASAGKRKFAYYKGGGDVTASFEGGCAGKDDADKALILRKASNPASTAWQDKTLQLVYSNRLNDTADYDEAFSQNVIYELSAYVSGDVDAVKVFCKLTGLPASSASDLIADFKAGDSKTDAGSMYLAKNRWNRLAFKFFIDENKYEVYINGVKAGEKTVETIDADDLNHFIINTDFSTDAANAEAVLAIDDFTVYQDEAYVVPSAYMQITSDTANISQTTGNIYLSDISEIQALNGSYSVVGGGSAAFGSVLATCSDDKIYNYYCIKNASLNSLDLVRNGGTAYAEAVLGERAVGDELTLIIAEYGSDGSVVNAAVKPFTLGSSAMTDLTLSPKSVGNSFKAFVWTSTDELVPITDAAAIK